ncbi:MAG: hypothetical protein K0R22_3225 [Sporomusa sp.]|nr:hypothetical protein [Sporomusa sp.]
MCRKLSRPNGAVFCYDIVGAFSLNLHIIYRIMLKRGEKMNDFESDRDCKCHIEVHHQCPKCHHACEIECHKCPKCDHDFHHECECPKCHNKCHKDWHDCNDNKHEWDCPKCHEKCHKDSHDCDDNKHVGIP